MTDEIYDTITFYFFAVFFAIAFVAVYFAITYSIIYGSGYSAYTPGVVAPL